MPNGFMNTICSSIIIIVLNGTRHLLSTVTSTQDWKSIEITEKDTSQHLSNLKLQLTPSSTSKSCLHIHNQIAEKTLTSQQKTRYRPTKGIA